MNDGKEGSEYTSILTNDFKRFLVDSGFDFEARIAGCGSGRKQGARVPKLMHKTNPLHLHRNSMMVRNMWSMGLCHHSMDRNLFSLGSCSDHQIQPTYTKIYRKYNQNETLCWSI